MNIAILLSGGKGIRVGSSTPKQYLEVSGKMILEYSFATIIQSKKIDAVIIVCADDWRDKLLKLIAYNKPVIFASSGETRQISILNGLLCAQKIFKDKIEVVLIHDAARPILKTSLLEECIEVCEKGADGAMPILPVKDTIYLSSDSTKINSLLDRSKLFAGQAPEAFIFEKYLKAHLSIPKNELLNINGSSELAFKNGMNIQLIKGDPRNFKITNQEDLELFKLLSNEGKCIV